MFNLIKEYYRKKRLMAQSLKESGRFTNLKGVESVSFAYAINSEADMESVLEIYNFLKWKSVKISAIIVESKKDVFQKIANIEELQSNVDFTFIGYNNLDWLGDIKEGSATDFFANRSNLFINFNSAANFALSRIAQRVVADMVIGMHNDADIPYTFIVADKDGGLLQPIEYLNQIFHYLKIINKDLGRDSNE